MWVLTEPKTTSAFFSALLSYLYPRFLRPVLFKLPPDRAHDVGQWFLRREALWRDCYKIDDERLECSLAGIELKHPVGAGAGLNKDGEITYTLSSCGFSFVTVGSVRRYPFGGNKKPWIIRYGEGVMGNAMGMPSKGVNYVAKLLRSLKVPVPIVASIAGSTVADFKAVCEGLEKYADVIEVNDSCPNVRGGKKFEEDLELLQLQLDELKGATTKPIFVKISPIDVRGQGEKLLNIAKICEERGVGISSANTKRVREPRMPSGYVGLSGKVLFKYVKAMVGEIYGYNDGIPIIATGGIFSGRDVFEMIGHGAEAVSVVTAFAYRGPGIVREITNELLELCKRKGFCSLRELRGYYV